MPGFALVQGLVNVLQLGRQKIPIIQHLLQTLGNTARIMGTA